mmetsp:Transcript_7237/g.6486  ORF Transcript_7237/g.6486 Transcript_7237/m.6486 type:complete len:119 (+) Transcript_7237:38-394(+)
MHNADDLEEATGISASSPIPSTPYIESETENNDSRIKNTFENSAVVTPVNTPYLNICYNTNEVFNWACSIFKSKNKIIISREELERATYNINWWNSVFSFLNLVATIILNIIILFKNH